MGYVRNMNDKLIDFEAAMVTADEGLCDIIHNDYGPVAEQGFYDLYCARHYEEFGEEFAPDTETGAW